MAERVKTGVAGLDELLGGGLLKGRTTLLCGGPGSGKTTLAVQFLYKGAVEYNEPGVFVTLTENPESICDNMLQFGWDLRNLQKEKKLAIIDARPFKVTKKGYIQRKEELFKDERLPFSYIVNMIYKSVAKVGATRLALDSLTTLTLQYEKNFDVRQGTMGFLQALEQKQCTSLLLLEAHSHHEKSEAKMEEFLTDGTIILYYTETKGSITRALRVLKLRGIKHDMRAHPMEITDRGIIVRSTDVCFFSL